MIATSATALSRLILAAVGSLERLGGFAARSFLVGQLHVRWERDVVERSVLLKLG